MNKRRIRIYYRIGSKSTLRKQPYWWTTYILNIEDFIDWPENIEILIK
jgi:hypothetical protein